MSRNGKQRIVVGVEGSAGSRAALRWALEEARYRDATVEVVTAFLPTYVPAAPDFGYVPQDQVDIAAEVEAMQAAVVHDVLATVEGGQDVHVQQQLIKGRAADTLVVAATGADMVVVGKRGRGSVRGLLLGSVSQQIAQHAPCPVVIIRADMDLEG